MLRLRGSHGLSRTARHPELSNYFGVGKGKTANPQSFLLKLQRTQRTQRVLAKTECFFKTTEDTENTEIFCNNIRVLYVLCSFNSTAITSVSSVSSVVFYPSSDAQCPPHHPKIPYLCPVINRIKQEVSRGISQPSASNTNKTSTKDDNSIFYRPAPTA